jgi:hypothetical protein
LHPLLFLFDAFAPKRFPDGLWSSQQKFVKIFKELRNLEKRKRLSIRQAAEGWADMALFAKTAKSDATQGASRWSLDIKQRAENPNFLYRQKRRLL